MKKRLVAFVMVFAIVFTMMPVMALAADPGQGPQTEKLVLPADVGAPISVSTDIQYQLFSDNDTPITSTTITVEDSRGNDVGKSDWAISDLDQAYHLGGQGVEVSVPGSEPATIMFRSECNGQYSVTVGTTTYTFEVTGGNSGQGPQTEKLVLPADVGAPISVITGIYYQLFSDNDTPITSTTITVKDSIGKDVGNSDWAISDLDQAYHLGGQGVEASVPGSEPATIMFRSECNGQYSVTVGLTTYTFEVTGGNPGQGPQTEKLVLPADVGAPISVITGIYYQLFSDNDTPITSTTITVKDSRGNDVGNSAWAIPDLDQAYHLGGQGVEALVPGSEPATIMFRSECNGQYSVTVGSTTYTFEVTGGNPGQGGPNIILDKDEGVGFVGVIDCAYPIFYTENNPVFKDNTVTSISVTHKVDGKDVEVGNSNWTNQDIESKGLGNAAVEVMLSSDQPATILFRVECGGDYTVSLGSQSFNIKINATNGLTSGHGWGDAKTQQVINLSTVSSTSDTRLLCEIDYLLLEEVGKPVSKDSTIIVKDKNGNVVGNDDVKITEDGYGLSLRFSYSCGSVDNFLVPQDYTIIVDGKSYPVKLEGGGPMGDGDNVTYYAIVPQFVSSSGNTVMTCSVLDRYNPTSPVLVSHIDSNTPDQNHPGQTLASVVESGSIDITGSNGEYTVTLNDLVMNNGQLIFIAERANTGKQIKINLVLNGQSKLYNGAELGMEYADVTVTGLGRLDIINGRIDAWNSKINFLGGITHIDASGVEKPAVAVTGSYSDVDITTSGVMIMTAAKDITVRRGNYYCALANDSMTYDFNSDIYTGYAKEVTIAPYMVDASATEIPKELSALVNPVIGVNSEAKSEEILKGEAENLLDLIMNGYDVGDRITEDVYNDILEALASADILGLTPIARTEILDDDEVPSADSKKVEDKVKALNDPTAEIVCFANISIGLYGTDNKWYGNLNEIDENMSFAIAITPEQLEMYDGMYIYVARVHNGETTYIPVKIEGQKIIFNTNCFSTYALVASTVNPFDDSYDGKLPDNEKPSNKTKPTKDSAPAIETERIVNTADETPIATTVVLLWSSGLCLFAVARKRKELE